MENEIEEIKIKSVKKISDYEKNKVNPFMQEALEIIDKNIVKKYRSATNTDEKATLIAYDPNTSEILGHTRFVRQIEIDEEQFTKLYLSNFQKFFNLTTPAIRLFGYIIENIAPNKDMFFIDYDEACTYTQYRSKTSIYRGLAELVEAEIIARGRYENHFFINPMVLFNGDRITFAKTYVKSTQKKISKVEDKRQLSLFEAEGDVPMPSDSKE